MSDLSAFGISATLPRGWDGQIFKRADQSGPGAEAQRRAADAATGSGEPPTTVEPPPSTDDGTTLPVAHLANFPLPSTRGDYGSGAVELMGPSDILVCLLEFDREATGTPLFSPAGVPRFRINSFAPETMQRTIAGMCGAQSFFSEAGRAFCAYVVLGSYRQRAPLVPPVNSVMASVRIDPA
jgi:hypothetical protein